MTKGEHSVLPAYVSAAHADVSSVMSGVITGPYFLKFFNDPTALEVGTMVAVLEIGAFGKAFFVRAVLSYSTALYCAGSDLISRWTDWGHPRSEGHTLCGSNCLRGRRRHTDTHAWLLDHGSRPNYRGFWGWSTIVCLSDSLMQVSGLRDAGQSFPFTRVKYPLQIT